MAGERIFTFSQFCEGFSERGLSYFCLLWLEPFTVSQAILSFLRGRLKFAPGTVLVLRARIVCAERTYYSAEPRRGVDK